MSLVTFYIHWKNQKIRRYTTAQPLAPTGSTGFQKITVVLENWKIFALPLQSISRNAVFRTNFITKLPAISRRKALVIYLVEIKFPENKLSSSILY